MTVKIVICWSGEQSRRVALALHEWIPEVVPNVEPWMSHKDIAKGKDWFAELMEQLDQVAACLICVTEESLNAPWIHFEVGSIAAKKADANIWPFLVGVRASDVESSPLGRYQCTVAEKDDVRTLVRAVNSALGRAAHNQKLVDTSFEAHWARLKQRLDEIMRMQELCP